MGDINSILYRKLTATQTADDERELQRWLADDESHRRFYARLCEEGGFDEKYALYHHFSQGTSRSWKHFRKRTIGKSHKRVGYAVAVAAVIIVVVNAFYFLNHEDHSRTLQPVQLSPSVNVAMNRAKAVGKNSAIFQVGSGQAVPVRSDSALTALAGDEDDNLCKVKTMDYSEFWLTLSDGTYVHLNNNSTLTYPVKFDSGDRTVTLDGEAFFFVAKDAHRPFMVKTNGGTVKEYGTSFDVNSREASGRTSVVLVEGSISVLTHDGNEYKIKPKQRAVFSSADGLVEITAVDVKPYQAWNEGRFVFENCSLDKLMDVLGHWYSKDIVFEDEQIKDIHFTGAFDRYGELSEMLNAIEGVTNVHIRVSGRRILLSR